MTEVNAVVGANTIGKMIKAKVIHAKQTGLFIQIKNLHDKKRADGTCWNRRDMNSAKTQAHIQDLADHIQSGGMLPAIEVQPHPESGVQKVDGYCRAAAYAIADASGLGEMWVPIVPFEGTELDALGRISTSNKDEKLSPLETLDLYKSIREQIIADGNDKPSLQDIADVAKVSRQYVDQVMKLDMLDSEGRGLVENGKVTVAIAVKAVRADGENATATLKAAAEKAEKNGSKKASSTTIKEPAVSTSLLLDIHQIGVNLRSNIDKSAAAACESFLRGDLKPDSTITMPVRDVAMLLAALSEGERQVEQAKAKAKAKAEKAKQIPIEQAEADELATPEPEPEPQPESTHEAEPQPAPTEEVEQEENQFAFLG